MLHPDRASSGSKVATGWLLWTSVLFLGAIAFGLKSVTMERSKSLGISINGMRIGMQRSDVKANISNYEQIGEDDTTIVGKTGLLRVEVVFAGKSAAQVITGRGGAKLYIDGSIVTTNKNERERGDTEVEVWKKLGRPNAGSTTGNYLYYAKGTTDLNIYLKNSTVSFIEIVDPKSEFCPHIENPLNWQPGTVRGQELTMPKGPKNRRKVE